MEMNVLTENELMSIVGGEGLTIDPNGSHATADNGCGIDPNG